MSPRANWTKCFAFAGARRVPFVLNATRMYNEGQERCRLGKRPLIITHIHMHIRVGTGVLNTRHGQRTREMEETTRCRRAYHPKLLIWHGPRVGLLAIDEKCSFCEAVCCGVACPSTSITSAFQSLRSRACSKCCALAMSSIAVVQQDAKMVVSHQIRSPIRQLSFRCIIMLFSLLVFVCGERAQGKLRGPLTQRGSLYL